MKKSLFYLAAAAFLGLATSCQEKLPDDNGKDPGNQTETLVLAAPALSASSTSVVLSNDSLEGEALKLSWTSALPQGKEAVVVYTVYANLSSKDMYSSPKTFSAGGQLNYSISGKDLNTLVSGLGAEVGSEVELQFAVYAKTDNDEVESVISNIVKVGVSTFKEVINVPETLWIAGSATDALWDLSKAIAFPKGGDGIYKAEGINLNFVASDMGFKFYFATDGSSTYFFGPDRDADFGTALLYKEDDGSANLFQPAMNGYNSGVYTITFNAETLKITLQRTGDLQISIDDVEWGDAVYAMGGCFTWGWGDWTSPMVKVADKVYEIENVKCSWGGNGDNGFKIFTAEQKWSPYFAMTEDSAKDNVKLLFVTDGDAPQVYPGKLGYADGYYSLRADFNTMTLTITEGEDPNPGPGPEIDPAVAFYIYGCNFEGAHAEWDFDDDLALMPTSEGVYKSVKPIFLPEWCYFKFEKQDWTEYVPNSGAENYWSVVPRTHEPDNDGGFSPGTTGLKTGDYNVTLDLNTLTVTLEPATNVDPAVAFYLFGDGIDGVYNGWTFNDMFAMMPTSDGVYETVNAVYMPADWYFKFEKQDWTEYVRDTAAGEFWTVAARTKDPDNDACFALKDCGMDGGYYNVKLDLNTLRVTITPAE